MSDQAHPFNPFKKVLLALITALTVAVPSNVHAALEIKAQETSFYKDMFEQGAYYEGTSYLRLDRLYRALFNKQVGAEDINIYDEVPDSSFFTNRHARSPLSLQDLKKGFQETDGPNFSGEVKVVGGVFEGLQPNFEIEDASGARYELRFDSSDNFELATAASVIASRFYHAAGYNVPQVTVVKFAAGTLVPAPGARIIDDTGFEKDLTAEKLEEYLLFLPTDEAGDYRASATKVISGSDKGSFNFQGKRRGDASDLVDHERRRSLRALQVFASWLNNTDVRPGTTQDVVVTENGQEVLKHYLTGFSSSLGATSKGPKPPMHGHEYLFDFGETAKAFFTLGIWEKPWQRRWREAGEKASSSPALGYFDNRYFEPQSFKTQLSNYAFKDVSRADGFWAAKIIKSFSDDDIRALVEAGQLTSSEDAEAITRVLIERRDIIARYWYRTANPLDFFEYANGTLNFKDLAVDAGFVPAEGTVYHFEVLSVEGNRGTHAASLQSSATSLAVDSSWFSSGSVHILIRTSRPGSAEPSLFVRVELDAQKLLGIMHED